MQRNSVWILVRGVVTVGVIIIAMIGLELAFEFAQSGFPPDGLIDFDPLSARHFNNLLSRHLNQLLGVTFSTVAIAVPLTANMYSLKFLELFIKDPVNSIALTLIVLVNLTNTATGYAIKENFIPRYQLQLSFALVLVYFAVIFPYLYYIFRFLDPRTLLVRLEGEVTEAFRLARRRPKRAAEYGHQASQGIEHIANIAIRSVDRNDRNTAIESLQTLERAARAYWVIKPQLPPAWFVAEQNYFLSFSSAALREFTASRSWVEMKFFSQLRLIMSAAIPRAHDVIDTAAKVLRNLGQEPIAREDVALRELVMEYFNTFIRLALTRRDARSVFSLFDHYRTVAEALNADYPDFVLEVAYYFEYYGQVARDLGVIFIVEAIAHDLSALVRHAWETQAPNRDKMLERFLHYDVKVDEPLLGVKKAQALLASYFLLAGHAEPADIIRRSFAGLEPELVGQLRDDLLHIKRAKYWEVNERRMHLDYVPEPQRLKLREFLDSVQPAERV